MLTTSSVYLLRRSLALGSLLILLALPALGQGNKAAINGTVTDTTGAVVPGATVTVVKVDTSAERTVTAGDDGEFTVPLLDIGVYKLTASKDGFQTTIRDNIVLKTNDRLRVDFELKPGTVSGEVTISAGAPLVETESSDLGSVISGREVTELPLSGRNFTQLATLMPGVAAASNTGFGGTGPDARQFNNGDPRAGDGGPGSSNSQGSTENSRFARSGGGSLTVNGQRSTNNNFSLDGVDNNEPNFGTIGVFPNPDAIAEFKVTTSVPPAEIGRAAGAVINTSIKSGTNEFHGSGYYYGQNSALNAYHPMLKRDRANAINQRRDESGRRSPRPCSRFMSSAAPLVDRLSRTRHSSSLTIWASATTCRFRRRLPFRHPVRATATLPALRIMTVMVMAAALVLTTGRSVIRLRAKHFANATIPSNLISPISSTDLQPVSATDDQRHQSGSGKQQLFYPAQ